jgi:hypothetical protein
MLTFFGLLSLGLAVSLGCNTIAKAIEEHGKK